ncbi:MAG TPA: alpha/beta hydrolase [Mesorhizobium sp.]|jgi:alpha-beta hydrolase superfamily lysophospholipase|nr:alpha/beta hydrolase [Mesorhizobium sp.]
MSFQDERTISSPTGAALRLLVARPDGMPRAVVQINHGLAEHAARYGRFAGFLAERGFAAYAHDHRGHGRTRAPDAPLGRFAERDGAAKVTADVATVHDVIAAEHPGVPVIVFGHSMGGLIALNFVLRHPGRAAGVGVWNANFSAGLAGRLARAMLAWETFRLGSDAPSRLLPRLTFQAWGEAIPHARTSFDWLSRDPAEVDAYLADPLCGWPPSVSMWRDVFDLIFLGADDHNFGDVPRARPFHLVGGAKDPATNRGEAVLQLSRRMKRMEFSDVTAKVYAETRHESLNEPNRHLIMAEFADWVDSAVLAQR